MTRTRRGGTGRVIGDTLLNLAALGGLICIVLVVLAFVFNISLIMFKTGSMGSAIPAGSLALVREIPASEIEVGDVVTVERPGALPITHRVTSVSPGAGPAERIITMKGDANQTPDPLPYTVSTARIVVGSVPGLASVVIWFSNPWVLGGITIAASALVTWAFWPREEREKKRPGRGADAEASTLTGTALVAIAILVPGYSLFGSQQSAQAAPIEEVIHGEFLTLTSISDPDELTALRPGVPVTWQVGVEADAPENGIVTIGISGTGSAILQLDTRIDSCTSRWVGGVCPSGSTEFRASAPLEIDGIERELTTMPSSQQRWLLLTLTMSTTADAPAGESIDATIHATGFGDELDAGPGSISALQTTGSSAILPLMGAVGAVLSGLAIAGAARLRRRRAP